MAARLWHKAPFVRLLAAFACGILLQWYVPLPLTALIIGVAFSLLFILVYSLAPVHWRYKISVFNGLSIYVLLIATGGLVVLFHDVRNNPAWFGKEYHAGDAVMATLEEPLVEKAASYKALATVYAVCANKTEQKTTGEIILYFKKDSLPPPLTYGSQLIFSTALQSIKNAGNPGSFDYQTYSVFQGITHQVYLTQKDYVVLSSTNKAPFQNFLYTTRAWVVETIRKFITGDKEQGMAEALLIGYKDDLDKNLVQAYSNTGVVHIIAISGLHLGLIYGLLVLLTKPLKRVKRLNWLRLLLIISSLWLFSLLAGGGPSVLRSALMFSLIAIGEIALRKTNIFNTLAFSAFALLCINPFWLWDVGFQLSYSAVLSIVLFFQPIYNWVHFQNKIINFLWQLSAVTLAAQILTLPISVYHFHQLPLLFLFNNFIAVPLSSAILIGEILLCAIFFVPLAASVVGVVLKWMIYFMNSYIEGLDRLPFATWNALSINIVQAILLLLFVLFFSYWLLEKTRRYGWVAFSSIALFMLLRGVSFYEAYRQKKIIVYNVPKHPAIDVLDGRSYIFIGDSVLLNDGFERNFHLQPSRILHRVSMTGWNSGLKNFTLQNKHILLLNEAFTVDTTIPKQSIDLLVLSGKPKLSIAQLRDAFSIRQIVLDGSVPLWRAAQWKKDCDSLHLPCHNVSDEGAFVLNL